MRRSRSWASGKRPCTSVRWAARSSPAIPRGFVAAEKAAEILQGATCADVGFSVPPRGKLMINRNAMEHWDVQIPLDLLEVSEIVTE
ncbi:MAG: hypothetical protein IPK19_25865 [Chloroflexi bacterium]|nr:hypothetical protein [Chloroflexota bacterium]